MIRRKTNIPGGSGLGGKVNNQTAIEKFDPSANAKKDHAPCVEQVSIPDLEQPKDATDDSVERPTVIQDMRQPRWRFHRELGQKVADTGRMFNKDGIVHTNLGGTFEPVDSPNVMGSFVGDILNIAKIDKKGDSTYVDLSTRDAAYLLKSREQMNRLLQVKFYTDIPVLDDDWDVTMPGFNPKGGIYYEGEKIIPVRTRTYLDELLNCIHFKRSTDRTNHIGFLLTPLLGNRLPGGRPIELFKGNQPGIGKTTLAQGTATLASAKGILSSVTYKTHDPELEKEIGACILRGSNYVLIDNVSVAANVTIRSASIERTITMPEYNFRRIGTSRQIRGTNFLQFAMTYNGGKIGTDLASRCVNILMKYPGDPATMPQPKIGSIVDWVRQYRMELLAELLGMFMVWKDAGCVHKPVACRFQEWASLINGVLTSNGYNDFLATYLEDRGEADEQQIAFEDLAAFRPNTFQTAASWRRDAEYVGVFKSMFAGGADRAKDTKMGTVLRGAVGRKVRKLDDEGNVIACFKLAMQQARDNMEYAFVPVADQTSTT